MRTLVVWIEKWISIRQLVPKTKTQSSCLCLEVRRGTNIHITRFLHLTSFESLVFVSAPFSKSSLTAGASAALIAKNNTGMGNDDAFGLAPRLNRSWTVASKCGRLYSSELTMISYSITRSGLL